MIYLLPQLRAKNRYTQDWIHVWERELSKIGVEFKIVGDSRLTEVKSFFSDVPVALDYEMSQIKELLDFNPEIIFCLDIDFPGLLSNAIQLLRLENKNIKAYGYLHAGSWCNGDVFKSTRGKYFSERAMFDVYDKIFVATRYHKRKIEDYFGEKFDNIRVVGFPFYREDVYSYTIPENCPEKEGILITGRFEQSNVNVFQKLKERYGKRVTTLEGVRNRKEYFEKLNESKISVSLKIEETFGLSQLEAYVLDSVPLSPNKFSYPEIFRGEGLLYEDYRDLTSMIDFFLDDYDLDVFNCVNLEKYELSIPTMIGEL
jgi:hypothetical protein